MANAGIVAGKFRALRRRNAVYADEGPVRGRARATGDQVRGHQEDIQTDCDLPLMKELCAALRTILEVVLIVEVGGRVLLTGRSEGMNESSFPQYELGFY